MTDPLEGLRRARPAAINAHPGTRQELETLHGQVWDPAELARDFDVEGFLAPFVVVRRRMDGRVGSLEFQGSPRFYFNWRPDQA